MTVYAHRLFRALAGVAGDLGCGGDEAEWRALATRSGEAILRHMWSPEARLFTDVDGRTTADTCVRTEVKAAVGFYPMLTDLVDDARLDAMMDHLEGPAHLRHPLPPPLLQRGRPPLLGGGDLAGEAAQLPLERARLAP